MDRVNDDHEPVIVHRAKGKPMVIVSLEDWQAMDETTCLLSSPTHAAALRRGVERLEAGDVVVRTIEDIEAMAEE